ncbi:MAG: helix-turn-helix transcriptional regulator [Bacilli bacterium]|nr:helix-turn-helix transcriptional regulator [Bacilli bacterium]
MITKNIRKILSENVKYYRFKIGYTQEQLAEKCDISPRYLSDIENTKGNIPIDTLEIIAYHLKVEPYILLKEHKHMLLPKRVNMKK